MPITAESIVAGTQPLFTIGKGSQTTEGLGTVHSLWKSAGFPTAGATPPAFNTSGYVPDRTTTGAAPFNNPAAGNSYLARMDAWGPTSGVLVLYDRLWACSGFSTTNTGLQTITNQSDVGRYTVYEGIELWLEVYAAPGATGATWTITYTNQSSAGSRTATYTHPANAETVGQMMPVSLQAGDTGIRSVQSLQCSVSSGTQGDVGITLLRRIGTIPITVGGLNFDAFQLALPRILDNACLAFKVYCSTTSTGIIIGSAAVTQVTP